MRCRLICPRFHCAVDVCYSSGRWHCRCIPRGGPAIEWVNKRKIRAKDSVNTVWWFSKTENPKADVTQVLAPYSERVKTFIADPKKFYKAKSRPSGHDIAATFGKDNGGAIPLYLLQIPNTDSNSPYLRLCKLLEQDSHTARFPAPLPEFFIKFLRYPAIRVQHDRKCSR